MRSNLLVAALLAAGMLSTMAAADEARDQYTVAARNFDRELWDLAVLEFDEFLKRHADHALAGNASYFLGMAHVQLRQYEKARDRFRDCLTRRPEGRKAIEAQFRVGEMGYFLGNAKQAQTDLAAFHAEHPDDSLNAYALPYLAELAFRDGDFAKAEVFYQQALDKYPSGPKQDHCRLGLARALETQGQHEESRLIYGALASKAGNQLADQAQYFLGKQQYTQGEFAGAVEAFAELEERFSDSRFLAAARLGRGCALYRLKQYDEAQAVFESLQETPRIGVDATFWLGATHKAQQSWEEAAATLLKGVERQPQHARAPEMLFHAGDALRMAKEYDEARRLFDRVLQQWPTHKLVAECLLGNLRVAAATGDHASVDALGQRITREFADTDESRQAIRRLARSLIAREKYAQAVKMLEPLSEDATPIAHRLEVRNLLAEAQFRLGNRADAVEALKHGLTPPPIGQDDSPPVSAEAKQLWSEHYFTKFRVLAAQERMADAVEALKQWQVYAEKKDRWRAEMIICHVKMGAIDEALKLHAELLAESGNGELVSNATLRLAETLYQKNRFAEATPLYASLAREPRHRTLAAQGLSGLGWSQYKAGLLPVAADTFGRLLEDHPRHDLSAEAALARAQVLEKLDETQQALAAYQVVIDQYGSGERLSTALRAAAAMHNRLKQHDQAATLYQRLLEECPDDAQQEATLYQLAWALHDDGRLDDAEEFFGRIYREHPGSRFWADATFRLASTAFASGRNDEAAQLLDGLLATDPPRNILSHALFLQGRIAAATEDWSAVEQPLGRLIEEDPDTPLGSLAEYWRAEATFQQGKYEEAAQRFERLTPHIQGRDDNWVGMVPLRHAQALAHLKRWSEAQKIAEKIASQHPAFEARYEADYLMGRCLANQALFHEAREAYRRVVKSPNGGKTETAAMAQWMIGETFFHQKIYRAALREYLRVEILYAYPKWQAASLLQAGKCCEHLGHWNLAQKMYERIVREFAETEFRDDAEQRLHVVMKQKRKKTGGGRQ